MINKNKATLSVSLIALMLLVSCAPKNTARPLSAWAVYWDVETVPEEITALYGRLDALCHFSAVFGPDGSVFIPEATEQFHRSLLQDKKTAVPLHYITVVNDVVYPDGSSLLKDTDILRPLLADKASRAAHISELLKLAADGGYEGLEIDYETLQKQEELAEQLALFCGELYDAAKARGLRLRVVLEPSFPAGKIKLPAGPEYVVMLYNLFGSHSGPGPKADPAFIRDTVKKMRVLPGNPVYALAVGGFDWRGDTAVSLSESKAAELLAETGASAWREKNSGCLVFSYKMDGAEHTVWYADGETLNGWMDVIRKENGNSRFAVWRLGGNETDSLRSIGPGNTGGAFPIHF
jgi:spore germination protein YaaH